MILDLTIFHVRELADRKREILLRATSQADAATLAAAALMITLDEASDGSRFDIVEVNYGDDFRIAGPRGVIVEF